MVRGFVRRVASRSVELSPWEARAEPTPGSPAVAPGFVRSFYRAGVRHWVEMRPPSNPPPFTAAAAAAAGRVFLW